MVSYLVKRFVQLLFVLWGGATILFFLFFAVTKDPAAIAVSGGSGKAPPPQVVANEAHKLGLDRPLFVQYGHYLGRLAHGNLGTSWRTNVSVNGIIRQRLPVSLRLAFWAIVLEILVGIASGVLSARRRNSFADTITTTTAVVASAVPVFVLGYLIKQITGVYAFDHHWPAWARFPTIGFDPSGATGAGGRWFFGILPTLKQLKYLVQPAFVLASVSTAILARITRTSMLETMRMDHVRTARAKGLSEKKVVRRHILRNAMLPVVTIIGVDFGTAVGAAVLTETVFQIPGLGSKIVQSAQQRDLPVVLGLSLIVMLVYGAASLAVDLSYAVLDPRIRVGGEQ